MMFKTKHVYGPPDKADGFRVLVDRLWPRGLSKEKAQIDYWARGISPSTELRRWYGHDPEKWPEFRRRYREELRDRDTDLKQLRRLVREGAVTFVYASRETRHNSAAVLREVVEEQGRAAT